jgi:GH24 family phage-related lysozyme (muramidase)
MRHITDIGLALIKRFESFSPTIYVCPAGYETVGYGHVVLDGESDRFAGGINEDEAEDLLRRDACLAERTVLRLIAVPLTDGQFDALTSFVFNVGAGGLQRSTLRRKVNREEHTLVPTEFLKWVWGGGRKLKGLVRRREAEAALYTDSAIEQMLDDFHLMHD